MTQITLYSGGGVTFSPQYSEGRIESDYVRLVADERKTLTNGTVNTECIDIPKTDIPLWSEIEYVEPPEEPTEEDAQSLTRYINEQTGADDPDLVSATERLLTSEE